MSPPSQRSPLRHTLFGLAIALVTIVGWASPAAAHLPFESSDPADGSTLDAPVASITITFTNAAVPAGDEFVVLTPQGVEQRPVAVDVSEDRVFVLTFDPPLGGGDVGVRWTVQAGDAHPISGSFSFAAAPPTTSTTTTTTTTSMTSPSAASTTLTAETVVTDAAASPAATTPTTEPAPAPAAPSSNSSEELAEFLSGTATPGTTNALIGRLVSLLAGLLALGALAFLATAFRGTSDEATAILTGTRLLGGVLIIGALLELIGNVRISGGTVLDHLATSAGVAVALRLVGGTLLAIGVGGAIVSRSRPQPLSAAVLAPARADQHAARVVRWHRGTGNWRPPAVATAVLASYAFDGHTVSEGPRLVHSTLSVVHVAAGAVWAGGVVTLAAVLWRRRQRGVAGNLAELVIRFSRVASLALVAVAGAGLLLAVVVLDSPAQLTATAWGQTLLLKTAAVAIAGGVGGYNHFRLLPLLDDEPDDPVLHDSLRGTITAEAILLAFVVAVTAWLVAAAT